MNAAADHHLQTQVRRWRIRRVTKWFSLALSVLLGSIVVLSLLWDWVSFGFSSGLIVFVGYGQIGAYWAVPENPLRGLHCKLPSGSVGQQWQEMIAWPLWQFNSMAVSDALSLRIWYPFVAFSIATACLWYFDRRSPAPGTCKCGYDLTGNTSGRCPECGIECRKKR